MNRALVSYFAVKFTGNVAGLVESRQSPPAFVCVLADLHGNQLDDLLSGALV